MSIDSSILEKLDAVLKVNEALVSRTKAQEQEIQNLKAVNGGRFQVEIGCNLVMGTNISSPNEDIDLDIKYGDSITLYSADVEQVLKNKTMREFFTNCLLYFTDESNYDRFGIKQKFNICDSHICSLMVESNTAEIEDFLNKITVNRTNTNVSHTVFYKIAILNGTGVLKDMPYETREFVEKYFKMPLKMAYTLYSGLKGVIM